MPDFVAFIQYRTLLGDSCSQCGFFMQQNHLWHLKKKCQDGYWGLGFLLSSIDSVENNRYKILNGVSKALCTAGP